MANVMLVNVSYSQRFFYRSAIVSKVREEDTYDIKFPSGKIKNFVSNVSGRSFNSGEYVAVLVPSSPSEECKIIGKGRRFTSSENVPVVRID